MAKKQTTNVKKPKLKKKRKGVHAKNKRADQRAVNYIKKNIEVKGKINMATLFGQYIKDTYEGLLKVYR